jgi:hypothetical protein
MHNPSANRYEVTPKNWFRRCGKSGLLLPAVGLGCWHNFGVPGTDAGPLAVLSLSGACRNDQQYSTTGTRTAAGFLSPGQKYLAHVYSDDDTTTSATHVRCEVVPVDSTTKLHASLKVGGGQAVWIQVGK